MRGHEAGSRYAWEHAGMDGDPPGWGPLEENEEDKDDFDPAADEALEVLHNRLEEADIMPELLSRLEQKVVREAWTIWNAFASFTREELELEPEKAVKALFTPAEKTRFHDLRHTCATLLLGKSVHPKIVQELLGHATISITLDTYSHVLPGMGDQAANVMDEAL